MNDRRKIARIQLNRTVRPFQAVFEVGNVRGEGALLNLSPEGVFVASTLPAEPGQLVRVALEYPAGCPILLKGVVRWIGTGGDEQAQGFGVEISSAPDAYRKLCREIEILLKRNGPDRA